MIGEDVIESILARANIVDVVSGFVQLKKKGMSYEACCPFHAEKTPSFKVNPARGTWHCFGSCGEGGNVISFIMRQENMSFPEAVRWLGHKYGVKVEEEKEDETAKAARIKREAMFALNEKVAAFYVQRRRASKDASAYINGRWGLDYADTEDIGYAPDEWDALLNQAEKTGLSQPLLKELGLIRESEKGKVYDFFRNRVMIPIRDKYRRIIGFTARDLSGFDGTPKYLNSSESEIYHKEKSLFGLGNAWRQAIKEDCFYLVEGAPDAMRLQCIGINNAVAPLGAAWTPGQFEIIRSVAGHVCFLPDADPPARDEPWGTGIKAVMKAGKEAMKVGFTVGVREIPLGKDNSKNDPDSWCRTRGRFNELKEEDFIIWYARKTMEVSETTEQRSRAIAEVAALMATITDDVKARMYLSQLNGVYRNKTLWENAINAAKREQNDKRAQGSRRKEIDLYQNYKFFEEKGCYYSWSKEGEPFQWSNFTMKPMFHIKDSVNPKRLYRIKNERGLEETVEMKQEDLVSLSKFKQRIEGLGNYIWLATEREMTRLKMFLYEQTETAVEITQLGWQRNGFWAFGNGIYYKRQWYPVDELGIVRLQGKGNYYLPAFSLIYKDDVKLYQFERNFVHLGYNAVGLKEYVDAFVDVFGDNAKVGFSFLLATLFRDVITGYTKVFPLLNLFGPKGSGKSEFGHTLMSYFIIENNPSNLQNSTIPALNDTVGNCANALVHIDEFKNDCDLLKREFLKGIWDGTGRTRMNMDKDKKKEMTAVDSGVIVSGQEMATADIALFSRMVFLTFPRSEFSSAEKSKYETLVEMRHRGASHLTLSLLDLRPKMEQDYKNNYAQVMAELSEQLANERIEDRIQRNWAIILSAFRTLESSLDVPFGYKDLFRIVKDGILRQNKECKTNNELAQFWNVVSFLHQEGIIYNEADYVIKYVDRIKTDTTAIEWSAPRPVLMIQKTRIYMHYKKNARLVGDTVLPDGSLNYYLANSKEYLGMSPSVRFKCVVNGYEQTVVEGGKALKASTVQRALCFDYAMLAQHYGINLETDYAGEKRQMTSGVLEGETPEEKEKTLF
ncbi:MAG: DNA primase [Paraprevotella sp.]|nr:DNA primase [Paraprevotella sp.]